MRRAVRAFTLLEVLAALLILATAIFASLMIQGEAVRNANRLKRRALALAAAESAMDAFLAAPELAPSETTFESDDPVEMPGLEEQKLVVRRILKEYTPFVQQETLYVDPDMNDPRRQPTAEPAVVTPEGIVKTVNLTTPEGEVEEIELFDPGVFVAVRIEVAEQGNVDAPLVVLETWLPKPPLPEEATGTSAGSSGQLPSGQSPSSGGGSSSGGGGSASGRSSSGMGSGGGRPSGGNSTGGRSQSPSPRSGGSGR